MLAFGKNGKFLTSISLSLTLWPEQNEGDFLTDCLAGKETCAFIFMTKVNERAAAGGGAAGAAYL